MRKHALRLAICLTVLLLLFGIAWRLAIIPHDVTVCSYNYESGQRECPSYNSIRFAVARSAAFLDEHNWIVAAIFAGLLTLFTWRLWRATSGLKESTDKLWEAGERQFNLAKATADRQAEEIQAQIKIASDNAAAAQKSADVAEAALTIAERPWLVPKEPKMKVWRYGQPGMPATMWNPAEYVGTIEYGIFNMGRTVAFLKEVTVCLIFAESLPDVPDYRAGFEGQNNSDTRTLIGHFPIGHNTPYDCPPFAIGAKKKINAATFDRLSGGELKAFFFGYIRYTDVFEYLHTEGFCFRYVQIGIEQTESTCAIVAGKNYNYRRREKIPSEGFEVIPPQGAELTIDDIEKVNEEMRVAHMRP
jgi:hypothetical protein